MKCRSCRFFLFRSSSSPRRPRSLVTKVSALTSRLAKQLQDNLRRHPRVRGRFAFSGELNAFP